MDKVNFEELQDILKQAQLTIYNVDAPDDVDGFRFFTITQFVEFLKNCAIKNCFLSLEEILFELQYEYIFSQIRRVNHTIISAMSGNLLNKTNKLNELLEELNTTK